MAYRAIVPRGTPLPIGPRLACKCSETGITSPRVSPRTARLSTGFRLPQGARQPRLSGFSAARVPSSSCEHTPMGFGSTSRLHEMNTGNNSRDRRVAVLSVAASQASVFRWTTGTDVLSRTMRGEVAASAAEACYVRFATCEYSRFWRRIANSWRGLELISTTHPSRSC